MRSLSIAVLGTVQYAFLVCSSQVGTVLFGAALKIGASLVLAVLFLFVIERSPYLVRLVIAWIGHTLRLTFSPLLGHGWQRFRKPFCLPPNEPSLALDFQRPPPVF